MHHAREPGGMMALIYFMWWLLENYNTDAEAKALLDSRRITVVPIVNPDGYTFNIQNSPGGGGLWRKNRRRNANNSFGVDLNRNYGTVDFWNSAFGGSSTSPSSDTYRGTDPFSEPETAALSLA
jgi:murein tripeptide amidase MpaA